MNANETKLWEATLIVKNGFQNSVELTLNGIEFFVTMIEANRKTYYFTPTPALMIKANGKRISYKKAMDMLA